ncbi:hypothetical protein CLV63_12469 [Murinocardiopsis flavida]|uniref:Uncharacterized protein n=1 Tax=Murinocardiopsis flavida TaxID=645275 RepID=A0A2P8CYC2_9ACTN|nr:hypothetical protein CLV63_12469 [Murinocardiopsis flavida]
MLAGPCGWVVQFSGPVRTVDSVVRLREVVIVLFRIRQREQAYGS